MSATLSRIADVEIVGFADPDFERAQALASKVGARAYNAPRDLLERENLDAVYICVPPFAHGDPETAAIDAGLPFFVEKPLSLTLDDAEAIGKAVERSGLVTAAGYHWRYLDTVEEARGLLRDRPAQLVTGHWLDQTPPPQWWWRENQSGGQIVEQATHIHRSRAPSGRRDHRGLRARLAAPARARIFPVSTWRPAWPSA